MLTPDKSAPLVSILMGVRYQRKDPSLLVRAIRSIQAQTYSNWELLICERDSTEAAQVRLKQFAQEDSRIRLLDGQGTKSLSGQLNRCLMAAKGDWIARMDDDDFSYSERIDAQMEYLQNHPHIAFVGCNVKLCQNGVHVGRRVFPEFPSVQDFYMTQPYIHPTLIFRRNVLSAVGGYCEDKHCVLCEDYDLLLRLYTNGFQGANLQKILLDYSLPNTAKGSRRMSHRLNEAVTRWIHFNNLGLLPNALPYVIKPLVVGLIPEKALKWIKNR